MNNFTFLYPEYFFLIGPLFLLLFFIYKRNNKKIFFSFFSDLEKIYKKNTIYLKLYYGVVFLILLCFVFIFANLVLQSEKKDVNKNGVDINIVLDVSYSMLAADLKPNRLEVSKCIIWDFVEQLEADRVWLTVFAGKPFVSLPLNFDYKVTRKIIDKIWEDTINQRNYYMQGTAIWDALLLAWESFGTGDEREKIIVLLTDGEANKWVAPDTATQYLKDTFNNEIKVYAIGIWWREQTYIQSGNQRIEVGPLDEFTLKKIAETTSGKYFRASDEKSFEDIFDTIAKLEKKEITSESFIMNTQKNIIFVYMLLGLFTLLLYLIIRKKI